LSQLLSKGTHISQFSYQMFNVFALLWTTHSSRSPLTNSAITQTLRQFNCPIQWRLPASTAWLSWIVDDDRPLFCWSPKTA